MKSDNAMILLDEKSLSDVISDKPFSEDMKELVTWLGRPCWRHPVSLSERRGCIFCWQEVEAEMAKRG